MIALVLGLGNIGRTYQQTRHNVGFEVAELVRQSLKAPEWEGSDLYESTQAAGQQRLILARPLTYMNRSGLAAEKLLEELDLRPEQMLVVVDDVELPLGAIRFRSGGSDGGHNGLASIIEALDTEQFPRLRVGIGRPSEKDIDLADYVLQRFTEPERDIVVPVLEQAAQAVIAAEKHPLEWVMSTYNRNPAPLDDTESDGAVNN